MLQISQEYQRIFKDYLPLPSGKGIKEVSNKQREYWFRVVDNIYHVPPIKYIKTHLNELETLSSTFEAFLKNENQSNYNWDDLKIINYDAEEEALALINYLHTKKQLSCDIETRDLSWYGNKLLLVQFCWCDNKAASISIFTPKVVNALKKLFARKDITFIWHGGKYDVGRLRFLKGIEARVDEDTLLLHYTGITEEKGTHGLEDLGPLYLQSPNWKKTIDDYKKEWCRKNKIKLEDFKYDMIPLEILVKYGGIDVIVTWRLFHLLKKIRRGGTDFIYRKLVRASNTFAKIEQKGLYVNKEQIELLDKELSKEIEETRKKMFQEAAKVWDPQLYVKDVGAKSTPDIFNPNSPKQVQWVANRLGLNISSTDKKTLKKCKQIPFIEALREHRKLVKRHGTYVTGFNLNVDPDGRIRTTFNLHGTATGRLSSSEPVNFQNIPREKKIKNILRAAPGNVLIQADYKQAELCALSVLSGDKALQDVYRNRDDLHDKVAREQFGENFTEEDRVKAKAVNFGIAYGISDKSLSEDLKISRAEARKLIDGWFKQFPDAHKFLMDWKNRPKKGIPMINAFGRHRALHPTRKTLWHCENEAMNFPIQSVASDLTLFSLLEIFDELEETGLGWIVSTVHDSIVAECPKENWEKVAAIMVKHMQRIPAIYLKTDVPFRVDIEVGELYGGLNKTNFELEGVA